MSTILFIDAATSDWRETTGKILEVCCILADVATLEVIDTFSAVIAHEPDSFTAPDFHAGLLEECFGSTEAKPLAAVEGQLLAGPWTRADVICNRDLWFDMKFFAAHMPLLHKALARKLHCELKVTAFMSEARGVKPFVNPKPRTYRAPDDCIAAMDEITYYYNPTWLVPAEGK